MISFGDCASAVLRPVGRLDERALSPAEEDLLVAAAVRRRARADGRDAISHCLRAGSLVAAAGAMIVGLGDGATPALGPAFALTIALALLSRVEFSTGSGFTDATQVALVPMLFLVPAVWVPVLVAAGMTLGVGSRIVAGERHLTRILTGPGYAWHAVGPALVFALTGVGAPRLADVPVYLLAIAAQFALDYVVSAAGERISIGVAPKLQLRVMLPVWRSDLLLSPIGVLAALATLGHAYAFLLVLSLLPLLASYAREHQTRIDQTIELSTAYRNTAAMLADVLGHDDEYTGEHSQSVVKLALSIAGQLQVNEDEQRIVELGALLHDVGKIAIPKEIINKRGPLDPQEWDVVHTHTIVGQRMLDRIGGALSDVGAVVRASHERFDGGGYPDGTAGERIPRASRIISVADAFSAMTSDRPYRSALSEGEAMRRLLAAAGSQFDPLMVDALIDARVGGGARTDRGGADEPREQDVAWLQMRPPERAGELLER